MDAGEGHPPDGLTTFGAEASSPHEMAGAASVVLVRAMPEYSIPADDVAAILGVSPGYVDELVRGERVLEFASSPYERAVLMIRTLDAIAALFGLDSVAEVLHEPYESLGDRPLHAMRDPVALRDITQYFEGGCC